MIPALLEYITGLDGGSDSGCTRKSAYINVVSKRDSLSGACNAFEIRPFPPCNFRFGDDSVGKTEVNVASLWCGESNRLTHAVVRISERSPHLDTLGRSFVRFEHHLLDNAEDSNWAAGQQRSSRNQQNRDHKNYSEFHGWLTSFDRTLTNMAVSENKKPTGLRALPRAIWAIGIVSLLMDVSSESIHSVLPLFMVNSLGVSVLAVGILDGFAEATANIVKVFSGAISDFLNKRKALALIGYALSAFSKPLFPLATSLSHIITARVADRVARADGKPALRWSDLRSYSREYWWVVAIGGIFTLARFSEAFLVLRAQSIGFAASSVPLVMIVMNIAYGLTAYPAGALSDRMSHRGLLAAGLAALVIADIALASASGTPMLFAGVLLWGIHMGLTQGLFSAMVAGCAPPELRGTAFGFFNLVSGVALLPASGIAGLLWTRIGPAATFLCGGGFALLAMLAVFGAPRKTQAVTMAP